MKVCLKTMLNNTIEKYKDEIAYKTDTENYLYKEIDNVSGQLANALLSKGITVGERIGILSTNPIHNVITYIAALKIGAVSVPLNPDEQVKIFEDSIKSAQIKCCIVNKKNAIDSKLNFVEDLLLFSLDLCKPQQNLFDLAYVKSMESNVDVGRIDDSLESFIFFTSGSTGMKKGVILARESLRAFISWGSEFVGATNADKFLCHAPLYFDMSIFSLFIPFAVGGCCVLPSSEKRNNPRYINQLIEEEKINILHLVPSSIKLLLNEKIKNYTSVRFLGLAGEALPFGDVKLVRNCFENANIVNFYGNTEVNEALSYLFPQDIEALKILPIGRPLKHVQLQVLDADLLPCGEGEVGELYVHSSTMLKGYLNKTDNETFKMNDSNNLKYFPTGDLVKKENGLYYYMGRMDDMVKIQGKRVYLSEVRNVISKHNLIDEVFIVMNNDGLTCYIHSKATLNSLDIREYCSEFLDAYAIPSKFIFTEHKLPKTSTGKIDRKKLMGYTEE
ncbi:hypothetical protein EXW28_29295 (plasmid) [Bacillus mycoides]|uniref:AMP-binding protein n=1 Tax=Bacillus mycoides TaxID=1405 RepID=UPI0011EC8FDE|nr:AMP-binding protein [Bacillus mycoides]NUC20162.1 AMP-binding protein [Bacillus mycoides]QEL88316.1 hypothetical protein DN409_29010 [Bacillus mycoides]QWG53828.1 hypothetical protein EXW37_29290 [Bacillus mycoides]QWG59349.1 hypothetical protein EXW26_29050 [Bacillus mycoides]QWG75944.1 hypothetical protein EXW63_28530 [Bacillus mycoides]